MKPWYKRALPGWIVSGGGGGSVTGWPLIFYGFGHQTNSGNNAAVANKVIAYGFFLPAQLRFTNLVAAINTADNVNNSDIGIYSADGSTLLANIGAQHIGSTGLQDFAITQGTVTLNPGRYAYAMTSAGSTLALVADSSIPSWFANIAGLGTSSGGALPANIPIVAGYTNANFAWTFALHA